MKISDIVLGILCVTILGLSGFCYMLWQTKENLHLANDKIVQGLVAKVEAMQSDLDNKDEYIQELKLQLNLRDQLIEEMNGDKFGASEFGTEIDNQKIIFAELGGEMEYVLSDGSRVDIVTDNPREAIEIDWANKRYEGIGQAIFYMFALNAELILEARESGVVDVSKLKYYQPRVILLAKGAGSGWEKYRDQVEFCKMRCWVFDAETKTWLDKED